jgi:hypothetical protein
VAAPSRSTAVRIGKPRHRGEGLTGYGQKSLSGTATEPLDGGALSVGARTHRQGGRQGRRHHLLRRDRRHRRRALAVVLWWRGKRQRWGKGRGGLPQWRCASAVAGGAPAASSSSSRRRVRDRDRGRERMRLGFRTRPLRAGFVPGDGRGQPSDLHRTVMSQQCERQQATGRLGLGRKRERRLLSAAQVGRA